MGGPLAGPAVKPHAFCTDRAPGLPPGSSVVVRHLDGRPPGDRKSAQDLREEGSSGSHGQRLNGSPLRADSGSPCLSFGVIRPLCLLVLKVRDIAEIEDQLVAVNWIDRDRYPHGCLVLVERRTEDLEYGRVVRQAEKHLLVAVRPARGDPVPVADLLELQGLGQILHGSLLYVLRYQQPGGAGREELQRIKGGLQQPRDLVDVAHLVPADYLVARVDAEP